VSFEHKLGLVLGSFIAPGFAQAVLGRRLAALLWMSVAAIPAMLGTLWAVLPALSILIHFAALVGALLALRRTRKEPKPIWWSSLSIAVFVTGIAAFAFLRATVSGYRIPSSSMYPSLIIGDHVYVDELSLHWRAPERGEIVVFRYPCAEDRDYVKRVIGIGGDTVEVRCNVVYVNSTAIESRLVTADDSYADYDEIDRKWFQRRCSRYRETHGGHSYEVFHDAERPAREREGARSGDARDFPPADRPLLPSCRQSEFYERTTDQPAGKLIVTKPGARPCEQQAHFVVPPGSLFVLGDNRNNANDSRMWGVVKLDAVIGRTTGIWLSVPPGGSWSDIRWSRFGAMR
jgi:signal peptidase I